MSEPWPIFAVFRHLISGTLRKSVRKILLPSQRFKFYQHPLTCAGESAVKEETSV